MLNGFEFNAASGETEAVADVVVDLVRHFEWEGPVGIALPSVVRNGIVHSAANIDESWIDVDAETLFVMLKHDVVVMNDADAAGVAEMSFGAGAGRRRHHPPHLGTGIGSALFVDGHLVPNSELVTLSSEVSHLSGGRQRVLVNEDLTWRKWARRASRYLQTVDALFSPDVIIVGEEHRQRRIGCRYSRFARNCCSGVCNTAGIVGAAMSSIRKRQAVALWPPRLSNRITHCSLR